MQPWKHDPLAEDLAGRERGRKRLALTNTTIGKSGCRPDVWSAKPTGRIELCDPMIFEVKVSRADFLSDVRAGKWKAYNDLASRVSFAAPVGLLMKHEIPEGTGLIERYPTMWRWAKAPARNGTVLDPLVGWHIAVKSYFAPPMTGRYAKALYGHRRETIDKLSAEIREMFAAGEDGRQAARFMLSNLRKASDLAADLRSLDHDVALTKMLVARGRGLQPTGYGSLDELVKRIEKLLLRLPGELRAMGMEELGDRIAEQIMEDRKSL